MIIKFMRNNDPFELQKPTKQRCVCGLAIKIKKYLKAKERIIMETQIFHYAKIYIIFKKKSSKRNQKNPSRFLHSTLILQIFFFLVLLGFHSAHECSYYVSGI
jgi:hypothetical protein